MELISSRRQIQLTHEITTKTAKESSGKIKKVEKEEEMIRFFNEDKCYQSVECMNN